MVGEKVGYALSSGLQVIACIGEQLEEREAGHTNTVIATQLKAIASETSEYTQATQFCLLSVIASERTDLHRRLNGLILLYNM